MRRSCRHDHVVPYLCIYVLAVFDMEPNSARRYQKGLVMLSFQRWSQFVFQRLMPASLPSRASEAADPVSLQEW